MSNERMSKPFIAPLPVLKYDFQTGRTFTTMPELTKDESMSIVALAEAYARYQAAAKEYNAAREALDRVSRSVQVKMPWLKEATNFYEE